MFAAAGQAEELAREVAQAAGGGPMPRVHFNPLVSGDVVLDSRTSPVAGLIAKYYSDAIAIDMESAGVAEAAHRRNFHQAITIRGISDAADGAKRRTDATGSQARAAANAAAFAVALALRIEKPAPGLRSAGDTADFDLDEVNNPPAMDLALSHEATRVYGQLSVLETVGEHAVSRCLAAEGYTDSIQVNLRDRLSRGRDVCVRTKENGLAMLTIDQAPNAALGSVMFHYTLWKLS